MRLGSAKAEFVALEVYFEVNTDNTEYKALTKPSIY